MKMLRMTRTLLLGAMLFATGGVQAEQSADQQRIAREMIQVLEAYAVYKMGQYDEAFTRYRALANNGNRQGMLNLANMYANGLGTEKDLEQAFVWYQRGARAGDAISMLELADAYHAGRGVVANEQQAYHWYQQAAEAGEPDAQWQLAQRLLASGQDVSGMEWVTRAADKGQIEAQRYLRSIQAEKVR